MTGTPLKGAIACESGADIPNRAIAQTDAMQELMASFSKASTLLNIASNILAGELASALVQTQAIATRTV